MTSPTHGSTGAKQRQLKAGLATVAIVVAAIAAVGMVNVSAKGAPEWVVEEKMQGRAAVDALGSRFPEVAQINGMQPEALRRMLENDDTMWVDETGVVLYVDDLDFDHSAPLEADVAHSDSGDEALPATAPLADTFKLHSLPGAKRVVYLDFDGHDAAGSRWAEGKTDTYAEPFTLDSNPSFNNEELEWIQEVWQRMAEDFAPFAVDVTTEDPGIENIRRTDAGDENYGTRVAFSANIIYECGCGGVAYLGVFDNYGTRSNGAFNHDYYQPAWVKVGSSWSAKSMAEAGTHEAGHNLSLAHDGNDERSYYGGHGDWAPIMGVGYYKSLTQWSKGEYANASNTQDDLALIQQSGAPLRSDDHGNDVNSGTALAAGSVNQQGVISSASDVDAFTFTTSGGRVSVTVAGNDLGGNLDASLRLVDASGATVAFADPAGVAASLTEDVGAGTYAIVVDGVGAGNPANDGYTDYGSLGYYTLSGTVPAGGGGGGGGTTTTTEATTTTTEATTTTTKASTTSTTNRQTTTSTSRPATTTTVKSTTTTERVTTTTGQRTNKRGKPIGRRPRTRR